MSTDPQKADPVMPRGIAMMLKSVLGLDPTEIGRQFNDAFSLIKGFAEHADTRLNAMAAKIDELNVQIRIQNDILHDQISRLDLALRDRPTVSPSCLVGVENTGYENGHGNGNV